jgi:serine/threonine protein kinase
VALLTDFDLVSAPNTTGGTRTGMLGTNPYAAPEQLERPQDADARADVHGLGMTLVFAIYGRALPPTVSRAPERFINDKLDCSARMKAVLKRSIATEPEDRTPDVKSFCFALAALPEIRSLIGALPTHLTAPRRGATIALLAAPLLFVLIPVLWWLLSI